MSAALLSLAESLKRSLEGGTPAGFRKALAHALILLPLFCGESAALDPGRAISQYGYEVWPPKQGLSQGHILSIAQTPDGYLWLGTPAGLLRFDGVGFTAVGAEEADVRQGVWELFVSRDGSLWVGTNGAGLKRWKDGQFTVYDARAGLPSERVRTIYEDRAGGLWVGTFSHGLSRFKDGRFTTYTTKDGLAHNNVKAVVEDRAGDLWVATYGGGLSRFSAGKFTNYTTRDGLPHDLLQDLLLDRRGDLWIATPRGLARMSGGKFSVYTAKDGLTNDRIYALLEDRDGNLWIGTEGGGLNRYAGGRFTAFTSRDGLANDEVKSIYEDREGSLWIGTNGGGLSRLRDKKYATLTTGDGLSNNHVTAVRATRDGSLWVGTLNGLNRLKDGRVAVYTTRDGLTNNYVTSLYEDRAGDLWVGTHSGGVNRFRDGRFTAYTARQGLSHSYVRAVIADRAGNVWVGTHAGGLNRFRDGRFTTYSTNEGLSHHCVTTVHEDAQGNLWVGTSGGGLNLYRDGRFTVFTTRQGLAHDVVNSIHEDAAGALWVGTSGGLSRLAGSKIVSFTTKDGLFDNIILQVLEDDAGNLWMSSDRGFFRVSKRELNEIAKGKKGPPATLAFEREEGRGTSRFNASYPPAGWRTADGRLWFVTMNGLAVVDPANIKSNPLPPPVFVEQLIDRETHQPLAGPSLPPGHSDIEIHYAGLSLVEPEKVAFKYRLEGFDRDWVDAGGRRVAYYTNLPPGDYVFRVTASNNDGVWSERGASYAFRLEPHFHQTYWFYGLCAAVVALAGWGIHRLRVREMRAQFAGVLAERTRIARELHDTLLQGVTGVALQLKAVARKLADRPEAAAELQQIIADVNDCAAEARHSVWHLRAESLETGSLTDALEAAAKHLTSGVPVRVDFKVTGEPKRLPDTVENTLLRIGQEAITNAVRHARPSRIHVELSYEKGCVLLCVQDDGRGFDERGVDCGGDHFGLRGIRERAEQLGGHLVLHSAPGSGTEVTVAVPAR
jgi:ligand-binding sensor domain-containing protein/signal transduction histidine kinase